MFVVTHLSLCLININKKRNLQWNSYAHSPVLMRDEFAPLPMNSAIQDQLKIHVVKPRESSDYLWTINPIGKVPTLRLDDGSSIFDSLIICDYLIATYSPDWGLEHQADFWKYRTRLSLLNQTSDAGSQAKEAFSAGSTTNERRRLPARKGTSQSDSP
jgi:glutathione S-transferase